MSRQLIEWCFTLVTLCAACLLISACNSQGTLEEAMLVKESDATFNYLALGDSYTIGQGVTAAERWPMQLSERLEDLSFEVGNVALIAQTGWTTSNLLEAIENTNLAATDYNLVSLLIGVNNQYQGKAFTLFETEFEVLLQKAIEIAGSKEQVFVLSIPDYGVTPFGSNNSESIARELDRYNAHIEQRCEEQAIAFINITPISRVLSDAPGALAKDNLHPSGSQYALWVEEALPAVLEILSK
jgi:lysophospholipase L1-like esterase